MLDQVTYDEVKFDGDAIVYLMFLDNSLVADTTYAQLISDGRLRVSLSKDAGVTWTAPLSVTFGAVLSTETYGDGETETWGTTFTGADMVDANFRLRINHNGITHIYSGFGFTITAEKILTGVEVEAEGNYEDSIIYLDNIRVKGYYGTSVIPIVPGSQAYASDGRKPGETAGNGTGVLVFYDSQDKWISCADGAEVED